MTNVDIIDYMKVCTGKDILSDTEKLTYLAVLNSEVSIKRFLDTTMNLEMDHKDIWQMLHDIFINFKDDKDIEESLKVLVKLFNDAHKYLKRAYYRKVVNDACDLICNTGRVRRSARARFTVEILKELKVVRQCYFVKLGGVEYDVRSDLDPKCLHAFELWESNNDKHRIKDVGAILFKNGEYELVKVANKIDKSSLNERLMMFDYDIAIIS